MVTKSNPPSEKLVGGGFPPVPPHLLAEYCEGPTFRVLLTLQPTPAIVGLHDLEAHTCRLSSRLLQVGKAG